MKKVKSFILAAAAAMLAVFASPVFAEECLKVATGSPGKGYSRIFSDIQKVCSQKVPLCEVNSTGGLDNLDLLATNQADAGLVQVDTWFDMKMGDQNVADLKAVIPINFDYMHVIVNQNGFSVQGEKKWGFMKGDAKTIYISKFSDLKGMPVAVIGSAQLLVRKLDKQHGLGLQFVDVDSDDAAFKQVQSGQIAAAISISGWPSGTFSKKKVSDGLVPVAFDMPVSSPYFVRSLNYRNVGSYNVNFLAVASIIVTRPFTTSAAGKQVDSLKACLVENLTSLKEGSFEPGWKDVSNPNETYGVPAFRK